MVRRAHFQPDLSGTETCEHAIGTLHDLRRSGRGWQAGDDDVDGGRQLARRPGALRAPGDEGVHHCIVQIADGQVYALAQQVARQLAADITEPNESDSRFSHESTTLYIEAGSHPAGAEASDMAMSETSKKYRWTGKDRWPGRPAGARSRPERAAGGFAGAGARVCVQLRTSSVLNKKARIHDHEQRRAGHFAVTGLDRPVLVRADPDVPRLYAQHHRSVHDHPGAGIDPAGAAADRRRRRFSDRSLLRPLLPGPRIPDLLAHRPEQSTQYHCGVDRLVVGHDGLYRALAQLLAASGVAHWYRRRRGGRYAGG